MSLFNVVWRRSSNKGVSYFTVNITKLPLFPCISKTSETDFGFILTILREHFFKQGFLDVNRLVMFSLVKVKYYIKIGEQLADIFLF